MSEPHEVPAIIDRVIGDLRLLLRAWEHAQDYAYSPRDRGPAPGTKNRRVQVSQGKDVRKGNVSDPTGDIVVDQMGARRVLKTVAGRIGSLETKVKGIRSHLEQVFASPDEDEYEPLRRLAAGEAKPGGHVEAEAQRRKRELRAELERAEREERRAAARVEALRREIRRSA